MRSFECWPRIAVGNDTSATVSLNEFVSKFPLAPPLRYRAQLTLSFITLI